MEVFLSYARANQVVAEDIAMALRTEGHGVFFDRTSLPTGQGFHRTIRDNVAIADRFVFLVSPAAVAPGSYALTELKFAQEKWPDPSGRLLPVMVESTPFPTLPAYLRANTVLQPVGNVAAEVAAAIAQTTVPAAEQSVRVRAHVAYFSSGPNHPALFINVANGSSDRDVEVTHVWVESTPNAYALPPERPLPTRLRPAESWETWVYLADLPRLPINELCQLGRVRLSTGEIFHSVENQAVPDVGYVPGGRRA